MDEWLDDIGLYRKNTALDGTCLFRAVAEQVLPANPVNGHLILRKQVCDFLWTHRHIYQERVLTDFKEYLAALSLPKGWGSTMELDAISHLYQVDFLAIFGPEKPLRVTQNGYGKELMLCVTGDSFYDAIYTKTHVENLGFCQSIVYKILYEDVFKLEDLDYAVNKMLHDKAARAQRERYLNQQAVGRDDATFETYVEDAGSTVNVKKVVDSGAILFPYKVAKALDPDIFRNVDFDIWVESQKGKPLKNIFMCSPDQVTRRNNFWYGNGGPLRVGAKCHVRFDGQALTAHIQELSPDRGPAVVYIEELSLKKTVPYDDLIALPRSTLKPEWSYSHKHQMISKFGQKNNEDPKPKSKCRRHQREASLSGDQHDENQTMECRLDEKGLLHSGMQIPLKHSLIYNQFQDTWALVDKTAVTSCCTDGSDLPFHDIQTLRFFYNLGIEYFNKGVYIPNPIPSNEESPNMAELCHGVPIIQPAPSSSSTSPILVEPVTPIMVVPSTPPSTVILPPMTGPPPTCLPIAHPPPTCPAPASEQSVKIHETPASSREKGRGSKYVKPPRFQRLESARAERSVVTSEEARDEVQIPEISSTSSPPEISEPPVPVYPVYSYIYPHPMGENPETSHLETPYIEQPQYPEYTSIPHVLESPQPGFYDAEGIYRQCYLVPQPVAYYY